MKYNAPIAIPLVALCGGILLSIADFPIWTAIIAFTGALIIYLLLLAFSRDPLKAFKTNKYHYIWMGLLFLSVGQFADFVARPYRVKESENYKAAIGRIAQIEETSSGPKAIVDIAQLIDEKGRRTDTYNLKILVRTDVLQQDIDDRIVFPVKLTPIKDSPNYFDNGYADAMHKKGIYYESGVEGSYILKTGRAASLQGTAIKIRNRLESFIEKTNLSKPTQNFIISILLGDRAYLSPELRSRFADAGISHILALSGMHVAIIGGIILWILFPFNFIGRYRLRLSLTVILLFFYAFISGFNPSTVRAVIMMASMALCIIFERKNNAWNSLLVATFLILLFSPRAIMDTGLQLSFICVASMIFFVELLNPFDHRHHPLLYRASSLLLATIVATAATWTLTSYHFGLIPVTFLSANIILLPLLPLYLSAVIIYLILWAVGIRTVYFNDLLDGGYNLMTQFVDYISAGGQSAIHYRPSAVTTVLWIVLVGMLAILIYSSARKKKLYGSLTAALGAAFIFSFVFAEEAEADNGLIMRGGWQKISILSKSGDKESLTEGEAGINKVYDFNGRKVAVLNKGISNDTEDYPGEIDELVIGRGNRDSVAKIIRKFHPKKIIFHTSLRKTHEESLISQADSLGIQYHSIRTSGPYRVYY